MALTANQFYKITSGTVFVAFGVLLVFILENVYQHDLVWGLVLPSGLAAGYWGAVYGPPILIGKLIRPGRRFTNAITAVGILFFVFGFIALAIAIFGLASISYACIRYTDPEESAAYRALNVTFYGVIVAVLSLITGSIVFLILVTPFFELGFSGLLTMPVGWLMILGSLDYSGVGLVVSHGILASWTLYVGGLYLRRS